MIYSDKVNKIAKYKVNSGNVTAVPQEWQGSDNRCRSDAVDGRTAEDTGKYSVVCFRLPGKVSLLPGLILSPNLKIHRFPEGNFAGFGIPFWFLKFWGPTVIQICTTLTRADMSIKCGGGRLDDTSVYHINCKIINCASPRPHTCKNYEVILSPAQPSQSSKRGATSSNVQSGTIRSVFSLLSSG